MIPAATPRGAAKSGSWYIGIDIGGTKVAGGLVDSRDGTVYARRVIPTNAGRGGAAVMRDVVALAEGLALEARAGGSDVEGIGVGVAELVSPDGQIQSAHSIDWAGISLDAALAHIAPTVTEADVRAAALAEARFGAGRSYSIFTYISVGTGISSCLVQDGRPFAGSRGNALVLASGPISSTCQHCGESQQEILEDIASGPAIVTRYNEYAIQPALKGHDVMAAAVRGDKDAIDIVRSAGAALGNSVGWLVNVLDPDAVVVGGGLGLAGGLFWNSFTVSARAHIWSDVTRELPIVTAGLGADSGIIGAALAATANGVAAR